MGWAVFGATLEITSSYVAKRVSGEEYTWKDAVKDAAGAGTGKVTGKIGRWVERTFWVPRGTGAALEAGGGAIGAGTTRGAMERYETPKDHSRWDRIQEKTLWRLP